MLNGQATPKLCTAEESKWAELARFGDKAAFEKLVRAYSAPLFNLAVRMTNDHCIAEELVQETFLKAFKAMHTFDSDRRFYSWLYAICLNTVRDAIRRDGRRPDVATHEDQEAMHDQQEDGTEARVLRNELLHRARGAIGKMPAEVREPLVLRYFQEMTFPELAAVCGITERVAKSRVYKGVAQLQEILVDQDNETGDRQ